MMMNEFDAVLGGRSQVPPGALVLGGEEGRKREFLALIERNPREAIDTEKGKEILLDLIQKFDNHCKSEKHGSVGVWAWRCSPNMKLKVFIHNLEVFYKIEGYYYRSAVVELNSQFEPVHTYFYESTIGSPMCDRIARELLEIPNYWLV